MKRVHMVVTGRVQGVGFRYSTVREARRRGVRGWVRNAVDGTVEITAEGDETTLREFAAWCASGPPGARVDSLEKIEVDGAEPLNGFEVRR
jgi:acylphosphatase